MHSYMHIAPSRRIRISLQNLGILTRGKSISTIKIEVDAFQDGGLQRSAASLLDAIKGTNSE